MSKKIYLVGKKVDDGISMVPIRAYPTFESAKKSIYDHKPADRRLEETVLKNEFSVLDAQGNYLHTLAIRDMWVEEK